MNRMGEEVGTEALSRDIERLPFHQLKLQPEHEVAAEKLVTIRFIKPPSAMATFTPPCEHRHKLLPKSTNGVIRMGWAVPTGHAK